MDENIMQSTISGNGLRIDPRTKLLLLLVSGGLMLSGNFSGYGLWLRAALLLIPFVLNMLSRRITSSVVYLSGVVLALLGDAIMHSTRGSASIIALLFSGIFLRFAPCITLGMYLTRTTTVSEFVTAMKKMHVSDKITIPLSVTFRFFPTIKEESGAIGDAMRMRGIAWGGKRFWQNPFSMLEYRMVPLLMSVVKIGDELSAASLTRGLGSPEKRTSICRVRLNPIDWIFIFFAFVAIVAYAALGFFQGGFA